MPPLHGAPPFFSSVEVLKRTVWPRPHDRLQPPQASQFCHAQSWGQAPSLQDCDSEEPPEQGNPPYCGWVVIVRVLVWLPPPQLFEQLDQLPY